MTALCVSINQCSSNIDISWCSDVTIVIYIGFVAAQMTYMPYQEHNKSLCVDCYEFTVHNPCIAIVMSYLSVCNKHSMHA